ncbi:hypothetical protein ACLKA7_009801 [Drosophila subpalustris]
MQPPAMVTVALVWCGGQLFWFDWRLQRESERKFLLRPLPPPVVGGVKYGERRQQQQHQHHHHRNRQRQQLC